MKKTPLIRRWWIRLLLALGILLLVALPRVTDLNTYLIVDEADRWRWAEDFYHALISGDLSATMVGDGYPGIVPVWLETIWLLGESLRRSIMEGQWLGDDGVYMLFHVWSRTAHLAQQRLPIALFNTLLALVVGWTAARVYGRRVGLVALILIALNPFYLADSRVNRAEAVITGLLTLSVLFLIRYGQTRDRRWLLASGLLGGLSFLTKIQGLVVLPAVAVIVLYFQLGKSETGLPRRLERVFVDGLVWGGMAALVWLVLWPAIWVRPLDVWQLIFNYTTRKVGTEGVNLFFMGQHYYNQEPGWLFYPVVALLRLTPLTMLGLGLAACGAFRCWRNKSRLSRDFDSQAVVPLLLYVVMYSIPMSISSHKQDRYLMPIFLALDVLAAMGWVYLWGRLIMRWPNLNRARWSGLALAGVLLVQLVCVLPYHPYYFPYFNPLLGDGAVGARTLRVGWGEGMDLVADYLNTRPDAADLKVAARWHRYMLDFAGETLPFDESGQWTQADYMVLYIQQTQRMLDPSPGVIRYFKNRQPEKTITIGGIEYAQIYPSPFERAAVPRICEIPGRAVLLGYRWLDKPGGSLVVVWENQSSGQPVTLLAALAGGDREADWQACWPADGFEAAAHTPGEIVESVCDLRAIANSKESGAYDVRLGLAGENESQAKETFVFPQGRRSVVKEPDGSWRPASWLESLDYIAAADVPSSATKVNAYYRGEIRLAAYELTHAQLQPGDELEIDLYWQAVVPFDVDQEGYTVFVHLFGLDGSTLGDVEYLPDPPTGRWLPGQVVSTTHRVPIDAGTPAPAVVSLDVGLYDVERRALAMTDQTGGPVPVTIARLKIVPERWPEQSASVTDDVLFDTGLLLEGHTFRDATLSPGAQIPFELVWRCLDAVDRDYTVFVQLLDESGGIVAQADGVPVGGRYPTSAWQSGERIVDARQIVLPEDLPAGRYRLIVGWYDPNDGSRLQMDGQESDFYTLVEMDVNPSP